MKKYKIAIISTGNTLDLIINAIDFDEVEVCAVFGFIDEMSASARKIFKKVFQPLDMLSINCVTCGADYFLIDIADPSTNDFTRSLLMEKGIESKNILFMDMFGSLPQFNYSYLRQWNFITQNDVPLDFLVTGLSYIKDAFDVNTMLPLKGVNLARSSQDLYYGYKVVEAYLNQVKTPPRFCFIGLAPYSFNYWQDMTRQFYTQFVYLPILDKEQMQWHGTERGDFLDSLFKKKYKSWYKFVLKQTENQPFDFNDIDLSRQWRQTHYAMNAKNYLKVADELGVYGHKNYPETIERNQEVLNQYINLCRSHNVEPIAFMLPFSQVAQKHYPKQKVEDFLQIMESFKDKMFFINLWNKQLADAHFRNLTHLKMSGGIICTKFIKACIEKFFN